MISHQRSVVCGLGLALIVLYAASVGAAPLSDEDAIDMSAVQLQPQQQNGISYLQGGIGIDESEAIQQARGYNLHIRLSSGTDNKYESGVQVSIESVGGQPLLTLQDVGPMLYAKLPNGHYQVVANLNGEQQRQQVVIDGTTPVVLNLHWRQ